MLAPNFSGQHVSVEGHAREDPAGGAAHPDVPEGQPAGDRGSGAARGGGLRKRSGHTKTPNKRYLPSTMMFTLKYPEILAHLGGLQYGHQPVTLPSGERVLIIKHSKEAILTATLQRGFKIYGVPDDDGGVLGLITAIFDDADAPITLTTPMFGDDALCTDLLALLQQPSFEVYFFDEHDRELAGVRVADPTIAKWAEALSHKRFRRLDMAEVPGTLLSMTKWFARRREIDDAAALHIGFSESLYPDDLLIIDARDTGFDFIDAGSEPISSLVRENPGPFQERDIVRLMVRLFPPKAILLNPFRTDSETEFADVVVVHGDVLLVFQVKDSPNTPEVLGRSLDRKRKAIASHLVKAVKQMRGAFRLIASGDELALRTTGAETLIKLKDRFVIGVIVLREMFDDQFKEYSEPVLKLIQEAQRPCVVLDYAALHILTCNLNSSEAFVGALDKIVAFALDRGEFPRPRFLGPSEGEAGSVATETPDST